MQLKTKIRIEDDEGQSERGSACVCVCVCVCAHTHTLGHFAVQWKLTEYFIIYLLLFRSAPKVHGRSQARGQIRATAATLRHSSEPRVESEPRL